MKECYFKDMRFLCETIEAKRKYYRNFQVLKERTINPESHAMWKYPWGLKRKNIYSQVKILGEYFDVNRPEGQKVAKQHSLPARVSEETDRGVWYISNPSEFWEPNRTMEHPGCSGHVHHSTELPASARHTAFLVAVACGPMIAGNQTCKDLSALEQVLN